MSNDLPRGWVETDLGTLIEGFQAGRNLKAHGRPAAEDEVGVLKISAVSWGDFKPTENKALLPHDAPKEHERIKAGDLLISRANTSELVGAVVLVERDYPQLMLPDKVLRLLVRTNVADRRFLLHALRSDSARQHLEREATGTSDSMRNLAQPKIAATPIRLPPLEEQKRIVAKLEELSARRRRAKKVLDAVPPLLDQLRQSILAAAFRGDLTADWRAKNPNVESADKLIARIRAERRARWEAATRRASAYAEGGQVNASDLPPLPDGWAWATLEALSLADRSICYGVVQPGDETCGGVRLVRVCDLRRDGLSIDEENLRTIAPGIDAEYSRSRLEGGELLVSVVGTIGSTAVAPSSLRGANIARAVARVAFVQPWLAEWAAFWLNTSFMGHALNQDAREVARKTLNIAQLAVTPVPVPSELEAAQILRVLRASHAGLLSLTSRAADFRPTIDSLDSSVLARAFRGELVPQDPSDEPASVLLERIRAARAGAGGGVGSRRRSRKGVEVAEATDERDDDVGSDASAPRPHSAPSLRPTKEINELDHEALHDEVFAALWTRGPLEKDDAVRLVAEHLREAGYVEFQRLRTDGLLYAQLRGLIDAAVKAGRLDRPRRGQVRACKPNATTFTADDWRHAVIASLGDEPADRDDAIRAAAEWARDNLGLEFSRLRADGHIVEGLRSAINSAIRRGEIIRQDASRISRSSNGHPPGPPDRDRGPRSRGSRGEATARHRRTWPDSTSSSSAASVSAESFSRLSTRRSLRS